MKGHVRLEDLCRHGCYLKREGSERSFWGNPVNGVMEAVPRHVQIPDKLVHKICKRLGVPGIER